MLGHLILAAITLTAVFIFFLVIARTANTIINVLDRLEYLIRKEFELKKDLQDKYEAQHRQTDVSVQQAAADPAADPKAP